MELNHTSFSAKFYRWFYDKQTFEMPSSLCPYFWKLLLAYVFVIPYVLIGFPYILFNKGRNASVSAGVLTTVGLSLFLYLVFVLLSVPYFLIFGINTKNEWSTQIFASGLVSWAIILVVSSYQFIRWLFDKDRKRFREKKSNLIVEITKAKYNKYCPKITWK